jgi:hypothetical protein
MRVHLGPAAIDNLRREYDGGVAPFDELDDVIQGTARCDYDRLVVIPIVAVDADRHTVIHGKHDGGATRREACIDDARKRLHVVDAAA